MEPERLAQRSAELSATLPEVEIETYTRDGGGMDSEVEEALIALGYAGSDLSGDMADGVLADPKDKISDLKMLREAEEEIAYGRDEEAEAIYRRLIAANPNTVDARNPLADLLWRMGKVREAVEVQREIIRLPGVKSVNFSALAAMEHKLGIGDPATHLRLAKACDPRDPGPWVLEGGLIHGSANPEGALAAYRRALEIDSRYAKAWIGICEVESARRRLPEALAAAQQALDCDSSLHAPWFHKGSMLAASGKHREALQCLTRAKEIDPEHLQTRLGLTILHNTFGERTEALQQLGQAVRIDRAKVEQMAGGNPTIASLLRKIR